MRFIDGTTTTDIDVAEHTTVATVLKDMEVSTPNTHGLTLKADGVVLTTRQQVPADTKVLEVIEQDAPENEQGVLDLGAGTPSE